MKRLAYFARPITQFNNAQDLRDIETIRLAGFEVIEITDSTTQENYTRRGMEIFHEIISHSADALFFRPFLDGGIGAGVAKEIAWAVEKGIPVFEMPQLLEQRELSVNETKARLRLLGVGK